MNRKIGIISDSGCNISPAMQAELDVWVVPLRIHFEKEQFQDGVDLPPQELYRRMETELPKSSLPASEDILAAFDAMKAHGCTDIIFITISSGLSGCYNFVRMLAQDYQGPKITLYDSKILSCGQQSLVIQCRRTLDRGGSVEDAVAAMDALRARMSSYFVVRTLEYLSKGGRIGKVAATVGSLLHLNPVIQVNDEGVYTTGSKTIGFGRALDAMVRDVERQYGGKAIAVSLVHALNEAQAKNVLRRISSFSHVTESYIEPVSPVLGIHTGPGLVGLVVFESE